MYKRCGLSKYVLIVIVLLSSACVGYTQAIDSDLRQEIDEIKQNQQAMQKDLLEIKALLSRIAGLLPSQNPLQKPTPQPAPQQPPQANIKGVEFDISGNSVLGNESAKLILVEFTDYQCPFCGRYARETFPAIKERYIDKGAIRYAAIDKPLPIHPDAAKAAEASHCAGEQGKFWEMHEAMMAKQNSLKDLSSYARTLNLNVSQFEDCLNTEKHKDAVSRDMELANKLGINGVPGFIIGTVDENDPGKVTGVSMIRGAMPLVNFQNELDAALQRR